MQSTTVREDHECQQSRRIAADEISTGSKSRGALDAHAWRSNIGKNERHFRLAQWEDGDSETTWIILGKPGTQLRHHSLIGSIRDKVDPCLLVLGSSHPRQNHPSLTSANHERIVQSVIPSRPNWRWIGPLYRFPDETMRQAFAYIHVVSTHASQLCRNSTVE